MKPPPLLAGTGLLFWAALTGHWIAGTILAVLMELPHVVGHRSNLSREDFDRVWDLCVVLFVGGAFYCYMTTEETFRMTFVFAQWTPVVFAPMAVAQAYSTTPRLPLGVFSWFLRKDRLNAREPRVSTGYFYFAVCLVAASASNQQNAWFYPGLCLLLGWCLWGFRPRRYPAPLWCALFVVIACAGYFAESWGSVFQTYAAGQFNALLVRFMRRLPDATQNFTSIGAVGRRQLSARIALRLSAKGEPPGLLREATFSAYRREAWYTRLSQEYPAKFTQITPDSNTGSWTLRLHPTNTAAARSAASGRNTATVKISTYLPRGKGVLALPTGVFHLDDLPVGILETNRFASVQVDRAPGVVSFDARYGPRIVLGPPPSPEDLEVPVEERPPLDQIAAKLGLNGRSPLAATRMVRDYFAGGFSYSTYQAAPERKTVRTNTPLGRFLLTTKSGHCEYFATATTLLLREAGFPARYVVGYAVTERPNSRGEILVRERDAHAWCQVFDGDGWVDFDTTPGSWEEMERSKAHFWEPAYDFFSNLWFGFAKWRWLGSRDAILHLLWVFIPVIALMTWRIVSAARRQQKRKGFPLPALHVERPGLDSDFYLLERRLKELGLERAEDEAIRPWIARIRSRLPSELPFLSVEAGALLHYRYRFDPEGLTSVERASLSKNIRECLEVLAR